MSVRKLFAADPLDPAPVYVGDEEPMIRRLEHTPDLAPQASNGELPPVALPFGDWVVHVQAGVLKRLSQSFCDCATGGRSLSGNLSRDRILIVLEGDEAGKSRTVPSFWHGIVASTVATT
jgi:hypothetical protein